MLTDKKASVTISTDQRKAPNKEGTKMTMKEKLMGLVEMNMVEMIPYLNKNKIYMESVNEWAIVEFDKDGNAISFAVREKS